MKMMNIQALRVGKGVKQHMVPGKVYSVNDTTAEALIKKGFAVKAEAGKEVGKVYELPKAAKKPDPLS